MKYLIVLLSFAQYVPYFIALVKGETKPSVSGWFCFSFSLMVTISASIALGKYSVLIACGMSLLCQISIIGYGLMRGLALNPNKAEWIILCGILFGVTIWMMTGKAELSIYINIVIDSLGTFIMLAKLIRFPVSEPFFTWMLGSIGSGLAVFYFFDGISADFCYLVTVFISNLSILIIIIFQLLFLQRLSIDQNL